MLVSALHVAREESSQGSLRCVSQKLLNRIGRLSLQRLEGESVQIKAEGLKLGGVASRKLNAASS